jgi:hypothetical protein
MMWEALGGLALITGMTLLLGIGYGRYRYEAGYQDRRAEELQPAAYTGRHQASAPRLAPFPDREPFEQLATTGELRAIAEEGDIPRLRAEVTAFFRVLDLRRWTRAA